MAENDLHFISMDLADHLYDEFEALQKQVAGYLNQTCCDNEYASLRDILADVALLRYRLSDCNYLEQLMKPKKK